MFRKNRNRAFRGLGMAVSDIKSVSDIDHRRAKNTRLPDLGKYTSSLSEG